MGNLYLWLKAAHIVSVIAWMVGMLYLPRLFVYHANAKPGSELSETLKVMERRLLRGIVNPAMIATWGFGLAVATVGDLWSAHWLHAKLLLVLVLSGIHGALARWRRDFERDANRRSARFYRFMNEVPTLLLLGIVILAVLKPF